MNKMSYLAEFFDDPDAIYIALAVVALSILYYAFKNRGLPPGPTGIPYFGYWPFFTQENCHLEMHELAKKYGEVFSFTVTGRTFIHLGSYRAAKELHITKSDCFMDRITGFNILSYYLKGGVVFTDYEKWKTMRKFFLQQFRDRGMNVIREAHSGAIYDTVNEAVMQLKNLKKGEVVDIAEMITTKSNKIILLTLLGNDGMTEQELWKLNCYYSDTLMSMTSKNLMLVGEIARYFIAPFVYFFDKGKKSHVKMCEMLYEMINKRKATYNPNHIRDVVDAYFKERDDRKARNDPTYKFFTDECLMVSLIQMIGDGVIFMGMFVSAYIKALLDHPDEQEKLYQELREVCGDRNPMLEDKNKLTYTNAFIAEVMRTNGLFTVFPSMECTKETTFNGYRIPKGAITVYNFYSAHMNTKDYEDPEKFNPSRFIVEKSKRPDLLPLFGIGKRSCMGEGFAMNQVFLFLTTFVKNFRFAMPPGVKEIQTLFFTSDKINVVVEPRSNN